MATLAELFARALRHHQTGDLKQAEPLYRHILQTDPAHADAHHYLGLIAHQTGHHDAAIALMRQALALNSRPAVYHANLGIALQAIGKTQEALACFGQALQIDPDLADAHNNRGNILRDLSRLDEAFECYRQALRINPNHANAHYSLGNALRDRGRLTEAAASFREALRINPRYVDARNNLGVVLKNQGRLDEAVACYREALCLKPDHGDAHHNLGLVQLLTGDFASGWPEYEYRWTQPGMIPRSFAQPRWDGSLLQGKTILIYAEQGLGDTLQFIRYAALVKQCGGSVLFECQPTLRRLFENVPGIDRLIVQGDSLPSFDVQTALLSVPGIMGTRLDSIPAAVPYLQAEPERVEHWRKELVSLEGFKVGIAWQGNPNFPGDRLRSIPLAHFEALARVKGVTLVSVQKGAGIEQLHALAGRFPLLDLSKRLDEITDTAAIMMNLDLIVSSDTAIAHLAGALGVPVWTLLGFVPDWRWLLDREDSPWYPTMRLFRQSRPGDWGEVFECVKAELLKLVKR